MFVISACSACYADEVQSLLDFYIREFKPETALLTISEQPDNTGLIQEVYMELDGVVIENLRLNKLVFQMQGAQFNSPSEWEKGKVECKSAMYVNAIANLLERDINKAIEEKTFGDGDHWHDVHLRINAKGLSGKGYYQAMGLDILLEIDSGLKIVKGKELWLKDPNVKVNRLEVPDYLTKKALSDIQPLIDLNEFPLPLTIKDIELKEGSATLKTRRMPQKPANGIVYRYEK